MLIDAYRLENNHTFEADVCIVGAGPAGISIARSLSQHGIPSCLLVGGGLTPDQRAQNLCQVSLEGDPYLLPHEVRRRQFGGTANAWSINVGDPRPHVRYTPLKPIDFEKRSWVPLSGWPLSFDELLPYYQQAHGEVDAGPYAYAPRQFTDAAHQPLKLNTDLFTSEVFRFGPGAAYFDASWNGIEHSSHAKALLNAHAIDFRTLSGDRTRVTAVVARTFKGQEIVIKAKQFVIAAGGIESARLLMTANDGRGLGTSSVLGKYHMDHPLVSAGDFIPFDEQVYKRLAFYDTRQVGGIPVMGRIDLAPQAQKQHKLLNICASFFPRPSIERVQAVESAKALYKAAQHYSLPDHLATHTHNILRSTDYMVGIAWDKFVNGFSADPGFGRGGWAQHPRPTERFSRFELFLFCEQAPDASNRIELTEDRDQLGMRRAKLHWSWKDIDIRSVAKSQELLKQALDATGLGHFEYTPFEHSAGCLNPQGIAHHMGATRMADSPNYGVVDPNCKVFGVDNLFVSSSSVFPTGGFSNPTLTVVAMAYRLADHIIQHHQRQTT